MTISIFIIWTIVILTGCAKSPTLFQANGVKIGEVTQTSAIIWTRLTLAPERKSDGILFPEVKWKRSTVAENLYLYEDPQIPEGYTLNEMQNVVPGTPGQIRIQYWEKDKKSETENKTKWVNVDPKHDYSYQFKLTDLKPGSTYEFKSECRLGEKESGANVMGQFQTAPNPNISERVVFTVVTGQGFHRRDDKQNGHKIYPTMMSLNPSFFVHTGDIVYYDKLRPVTHSVSLARFKWNRMYALPFQRDFHNNVSSYFIKDDHDTWQNDCWPSMKNNRMQDFTFEQGKKIFLEQVPMDKKTYRTVRWGKDLQIWLVEGRDFRSPNTMLDGPHKTIWGNEQKEWFKNTVKKSDATFKVLISPTPIVGPDRVTKNDNHSNTGFKHEGDELRQFISKQRNMVIVCGDRHWQYVSVDPETGVKEYSCGPTSDEHAGGFKLESRQSMHQYLNICGGFLSGTIERVNGRPTLTFRHYSVNGEILNEDSVHFLIKNYNDPVIVNKKGV
jgi:alkaline phosphatase D